MARTRLGAGTLLGSGTISNASDAAGVCCRWKRACAKLRDGEMRTPFLKHGDRVRIGMRDDAGASLFGDIDQEVEIPATRRCRPRPHLKPPQPERSARWPNPLRSPCCTATGAARPPTRIALALKGQPYRSVTWQMAQGEHLQPAYRRRRRSPRRSGADAGH